MALPATDNFNGGTQGEQLTTYSASWTLCNGDWDIQPAAADVLAPDDPGFNLAGWNADSFDDDQYAEATVDALASDIWIGLAVRCDVSTPEDDGYCWNSSTAYSWLGKLIDGVETQLGNDGGAWGAAEVCRLEASGTTLTPMIDGSEEDPPGAQTDASLASGAAGVSGYGDSSLAQIDDWEGGNLAAGISIPVAMASFRRRRAA